MKPFHKWISVIMVVLAMSVYVAIFVTTPAGSPNDGCDASCSYP